MKCFRMHPLQSLKRHGDPWGTPFVTPVRPVLLSCPWKGQIDLDSSNVELLNRSSISCGRMRHVPRLKQSPATNKFSDQSEAG